MISQVSITLHNPKKSAEILAAITKGSVAGLEVGGQENSFEVTFGQAQTIVRILPDGMIIHPTQEGAQYKLVEEFLPYGTTHFRIKSEFSEAELLEMAKKFGCHTLQRQTDQGAFWNFG